MARGKGTANLAASLEVLAGAPLDARDVCPTVADLYVAANWPYKYIGMKTTVQATGDTYRLVNLDVTQESSWVKEGATEYADFTGATSQAAGAHGLVPAPAIADIEKFLKGDGTWAVVPMPSFDYSNTSPDAMNFSTDEKIIGTWVDGKPLYQKTVSCGALPNNTTKNIAHGIANIGVIINCFGFAINTGGLLTLPNLYPKNLNGCVGIGANATDIYIVTATNQSSWTESYLTIQYTKTTDSPVAFGEKIIGQWIDGKPLYQKVVSNLNLELSWYSQYNTETSSIDLTDYISDIDTIINGFAIEENGCSYPIKFDGTSFTSIKIKSFVDGTIIAFAIQYTKTTD